MVQNVSFLVLQQLSKQVYMKLNTPVKSACIHAVLQMCLRLNLCSVCFIFNTHQPPLFTPLFLSLIPASHYLLHAVLQSTYTSCTTRLLDFFPVLHELKHCLMFWPLGSRRNQHRHLIKLQCWSYHATWWSLVHHPPFSFVSVLIFARSWGKYLALKLLNTSLCSPASCQLCQADVRCWTGSVQCA